MVPGERRKKPHLLCLSGKADEAACVLGASGVYVVFFGKWKYVGYVGEPCRLEGFFFAAESLLLGTGRRFSFLPAASFGRSRRSRHSRQLGSCEPIGNSVFMFLDFFFGCVLNREKCQSVKIKDRSRFWLVGQCTRSRLKIC